MTERIKAGPERELSIYTTTQAVCPKCKHQGLIPYGVEKSATAPIAQTNCPICNALVDVEFTAGPGWGHEPDDLLHLASSDAPSALLPEAYLRASIEGGVREVRGLGPSDHDMVLAIAADVISELLEIRKFQRGERGDLSETDRTLLVEIANAFVKAGGTLTEDIARLVRP